MQCARVKWTKDICIQVNCVAKINVFTLILQNIIHLFDMDFNTAMEFNGIEFLLQVVEIVVSSTTSA